MGKFLVGIDAGHGMNTSGKQSCAMDKDLVINGKLVRAKGKIIKENEWNRGVAEYLAKALNRCGIDYYFTADMTGKIDIPINTRTSRANAKKCDILVSCHYNAIGSCAKWQTKANGLLVIKTKNCQSKSVTLANKIYDNLKSDIKYDGNGATRYGVMTDVNINGYTLGVLRQTTMPSCLIEYGFMDYKNEAYKMLDTKHQQDCAESTCKGICKYFGVTYKKPNGNVETPANPTTPKPSTPNDSLPGKYIVRYLQECLNDNYGCKLAIDGSFGSLTQAQVSKHYLRLGCTGRHVEWLQQALVNRGYKIAIDKSFGNATLDALKQYQKARGIDVDGFGGIGTHRTIIND